MINLPDIVARFDEFSVLDSGLRADRIDIDVLTPAIKDLRCWVKHFYEESPIPELTKIKAL